MLNDRQIFEQVTGVNKKFHHRINIVPFSRDNLGPNSYDLTLSKKYRKYIEPHDFVDVTKAVPQYSEDIEHYDGIIWLHPQETIVVMSREIVTVRRPYVGIISPRSSIARLPINICYSHLVDTGYSGVVGASISNLSKTTFAFKAGQRFVQIMFHSSANQHYLRIYTDRPSSKYLSNNGSSVPVYKIDKEWLDANKL